METVRIFVNPGHKGGDVTEASVSARVGHGWQPAPAPAYRLVETVGACEPFYGENSFGLKEEWTAVPLHEERWTVIPDLIREAYERGVNPLPMLRSMGYRALFSAGPDCWADECGGLRMHPDGSLGAIRVWRLVE